MSNKGGPGKAAYDKAYESSPQQIKNREERNKARYQAEKKGIVHKGDGKDIDHKKPLIEGGSNDPSNRRVRSETANRGWRKGESGYKP